MSAIAPPDFGMLRIDTPLGAVNFPIMPGAEAIGSAVIDPDGTVKIHVIVDPNGPCRRRCVYRVSRKTDPSDGGSLGFLNIDLVRDDGACPI